MADAVRLAPRLWDGQRLLRFLAGLAMLAMAFAAHAGLIGPAAVPPPAASATVTVVERVASADAVTDGDEIPPATQVLTVGYFALLILLAAVVLTPVRALRSAEPAGIRTRGPPLR